MALEPDRTIDNAYSVITLAPSSGRIYVAYNMNVARVHRLNGHNISRVDELGQFVFKYSDSGGLTWSSEHYVIPYRETAVDRHNSFAGKTKIMWSVDQSKVRDGTVYWAFTKIGSYTQEPPQEGYFLASPNLLTESDPTKIRWDLLPDGDHGPGPVGAQCAFPSNASDCVAEEWHIIPLTLTKGFFAVFRTTQGFLGSARTADPSGRTGWQPSTYAQYMHRFQPSALKNPRGPITLKRFSNGKYLMLWYNDGSATFGHSKGEMFNNRMPYWLSAGRETKDGAIEFSAPEIVLYNRSGILAGAACRPGYPDFIEDVDGAIFITETDKTSALCHRVDPELLALLFAQGSSTKVPTAGLALSFGAQPAQQHPLPAHSLPDLGAPYTKGLGVTLELWLEDHVHAKRGETLVDTVPRSAFKLNVTSSKDGVATRAYPLTLWLDDGSGAAQPTAGGTGNTGITVDEACSLQLTSPGRHQLGVILDAGPQIVLFVVDGVLCDGGPAQLRGWQWLYPALGGDLGGGVSALSVAPGGYGGKLLGGKVFGRALAVSELVASWAAGRAALTVES